MEFGLSCNIIVREEEVEDKRIFVVNCEELGISDYGIQLRRL